MLPSLPIAYPKILAAAEPNDPDRYWIILEDLGRLTHQFTEKDFYKSVKLIPYWHRLPVHTVPDDFTGHKPMISEVIDIVQEDWKLTGNMLGMLGLAEQRIDMIGSFLLHSADGFAEQRVVSHGDFHTGNIAVWNDGISVMDWEAVHRNSIFWDLYTLIDMPHPRIRKLMVSSIRVGLLHAYIAERTKLGLSDVNSSFIRDYHVFACLYSIWMLLLVEDDLKKGLWGESELHSCRKEIYATIQDCLDYVGKDGGREM